MAIIILDVDDRYRHSGGYGGDAMNPADKKDHDWLHPEVDVQADTERPQAPDNGVMRADEWGGRSTHYPTLADAMMLPPETPEALIYGRDGILAESCPDRCEWIATVPGCIRLEREIARVA